MANGTLLFLLGGRAAQEVYAEEFVKAAGGRQASMAALVQTCAGWEEYKVEITRPWIERGVSRFSAITPDENGVLDERSASAALSNATGILICGGNTAVYHRLYASDPIGTILREKYQAGVPVAGISAGALISLETCRLTPDETGGSELQVVRGLSLASGFVVGVHFTEWHTLPEVLEVMAKTRTGTGFGIDEPACMVYRNGTFARVLGESVFRIQMTDFEKAEYEMTPL